MRRIKLIVAALIPFLSGLFSEWRVNAAITNPAPSQVFATGTAAVEFGWDPIEAAESYELKLVFNGSEFAVESGIGGTVHTLTNAYAPGYYMAFVRGITPDSNFPWSDPVTFVVERGMTPCTNFVYESEPGRFTWTRSPPATQYLLKLAQLDKETGTYRNLKKLWIPQPKNGPPGWDSFEAFIPNGKFRWSITDYAGDAPGYTSIAYFQVKLAGDNYMLVDLSGGPAAGRYPVTYLSRLPEGGWTDVHKTSKLVLRKIPAGSFMMGSPTNELGRLAHEVLHPVTLTKSFYIGVFEMTQRQWELVMGTRPSWFNNSAYYATRPVEKVTYYQIRKGTGSFMNKLRTKTGLAGFDLPTEAQWEYACRAGTTTALNSGKNLTNKQQDPKMAALGRYLYNSGPCRRSASSSEGTAVVGSYLPNAWGLYDMHGNVWESCRDRYGAYSGPEIDPAPLPSLELEHVGRGGSFDDSARGCRSAGRDHDLPNYADWNGGFRAAMTLP